jgi:dCTP deaminase
MGVLPDHEIRRRCLNNNPTAFVPDAQRLVIKPFEEGVHRPGVISYGLSSYGYDIRVGYKFKVFSNVNCAVVDPKGMDERAFVDVDLTPLEHDWHLKPDGWGPQYGPNRCTNCEQTCWDIPAFAQPCKKKPDHVLIPPNSFALAETVEYLEIPRDVLVVGIGKSTMARAGIILNVTPLEPMWRGKITLEISNSTPLPVKVYAGEGICQLLFFQGTGVCEKSYQDKSGRYQDQAGLTLPFVK